MPKRHGLLQGTIILMAATVLTKIIGAVFKIPITNILGGTGMGYFSTAYSLFGPVYAIAAGGLPTAVVKLVAENVALGQYATARKIKQVALIGFVGVGLAGSVAMFLLARPFSSTITGNTQAYLSILAIAPSILFCCIIAVYRGYYEGMQNMIPTATSEIVESLAKLIFGLGLAIVVERLGMQQYETTGMVFGKHASTFDEASMLVLPYAAAAAVFGVTLSSFAGMLFLIVRHRIKGDGCTNTDIASSPPAARKRDIMRRLIRIAIPISIGGVVISLTSLIDLTTIMRGLNSAITDNTDYFISRYGHALDRGAGIEDLANFIYGSYTGLAVAIFTLMPSFTVMLGKSALPGITAAWASGDHASVSRNAEAVLRATMLMAVPIGIGICVLARPLLSLLYAGRTSEIEIAAVPLSILGVGAIMIALATPLFAILQAIGRTDLPIKLLSVGALLKLAGNALLIPITHINILGAAISTTVCYTVIVILALAFLLIKTGVRMDISIVLTKPLIAGLLCGGGAWLAYRTLEGVFSALVQTVTSVGFGAIIYIIVIFVIKGIDKNEIINRLKRMRT